MTTSAILEKRTSESIQYDINCAFQLDAGEIITGTPAFSADQAGLVFGTASVNTQALNYDDGTTAAAGKVIQIRISGGVIKAGQTEQIYTIRAVFSTSMGNTREATVMLNINDAVA